MFRVGFGYDVHALEEGLPLILGGVRIPHTHGLKGHSDADVLTHAICDALLGALALGDLGVHFPDTDPQYRNISSLLLLKNVVQLLRQQKYEIGNIDTTIVAQSPKLASYIPQIRNQLAESLSISSDFISVKATTTEHLGFVGEKRGMAAYAVVLIKIRDE